MLPILITKLIYLFSIYSDIRADAYKIKYKTIHHDWEMWQLILLLTIVPMWFADVDLLTTILTAASYFFLRAGLFNPGLNKVRKLKITHLGSVWFDKLHKPLRRIQLTSKFPALTIIYCIYTFIGIDLAMLNILQNSILYIIKLI